MRVAVLGSGTMGSGIAQLAAMHEMETTMYDVAQEALDKAASSIDYSLERFLAKQTLTEDQASGVRSRLTATTDLEEAVAGADVVIEAVPEDLELKQRVLSQTAAVAGPDALLGTNTSQLSISSIGTALGESASRLVGTHFFNPPVLMKLVELVRGAETSSETMKRARAFAEDLGKEVVVLEKDSPGFITTRVSAIVRLECLRILDEGVASAEDIDKACRLGLGFPMGPIELGDFNGLDTYLLALESLEAAHGERFRPSDGLREMVAAGRLGRKTGRGFYEYDANGRPVDSNDDRNER